MNYRKTIKNVRHSKCRSTACTALREDEHCISFARSVRFICILHNVPLVLYKEYIELNDG
ncbi:hypothetical protein T06_19 [Trichinella sp. T6]|nr:hypothetical protein T06_10192 [Trichinella sp. T6]KRX71933.1 hypothetical protein T06_19 [Trichinella sp. T6]